MIRRLLFSLLILFSISLTRAQTPMEDFMARRFGMFIHFGPVTLRGTEIGWSRSREVPQAEYDTLYKEFNPALFNADTWVQTAKEAGMKYLTITAKHHDGFCLWPTAVSPYNIGNSPFKRDIVGELAAACKRQGIAFCIYFTVLDWQDPDYPTKSPYDSTLNVKGDMPKFVNTMKQELKELVTKYHPFMLWFDGYWERYWTLHDGKEIYSYLKKLDPKLIINNRIGKGGESLSDPQSLGDFLTPEQTIGKLNMDEPWESCITICNQWAWKPNDNMKPLKECIQTLQRTAGGNGNLLFNVGPMMDGRMEARQITRLREMGAWLKKYGESIYGTHGGPWPPAETMASTRKGNKVYIHILENKGTLSLTAIPDVAIQKAWFMGGPAVQVTRSPTTWTVDLSGSTNHVLVLELDRSAERLPIIH